MAYSSFWEAYQAKNPSSPYTPAAQTWTPANTQNLANAYSAVNPTWTPPATQNAALPQPINPVTFDPMGDVSYAAATGTYGYTDKDGVYHPGTLVQNANNERTYQGHNIGQSTGYDAQGNLITSGADLNPYAQAAVLKRNYDSSVRGTTNSYAAQGQLYSGALKNAQATNDWNYGASSDQLQRGAANAYHAQDQAVVGATDSSIANLAALLGPAFTNFLASQKGY